MSEHCKERKAFREFIIAREWRVVHFVSEVWHGVQGWFDDRVEARNALAKVGKLWQISAFDRAELPWMDLGERDGRMFNKAEV